MHRCSRKLIARCRGSGGGEEVSGIPGRLSNARKLTRLCAGLRLPQLLDEPSVFLRQALPELARRACGEQLEKLLRLHVQQLQPGTCKGERCQRREGTAATSV